MDVPGLDGNAVFGKIFLKFRYARLVLEDEFVGEVGFWEGT